MEQAPGTVETPLASWLGEVGPAEAFATLAELVPHAAVFAVNHHRDVVLWNDGAERLLGFTRAEVIGRHCLVGIRCPRCLGGCGIAEFGQVRDVPQRLHHADGSVVLVRKTARAFHDAEGRFLGGVEVLVPDEPAAARREAPAPRGDVVEFHGMVTRDPAMLHAIEIVRNVARSEATVLVRGESGTGKELVARAVHLESDRKSGPFVAVNCGALTPSLLESELFGHVRGAFTGAVADRPGIFVQADKGTLFLDEVAELPLEMQAKLLRVLQERVVVPVGGTKPVRVDVRVVAATHRGLREEVRAGRFREDLMYRLRVVPIFLPALRERPADIELLLRHFVDKANQRGPRRVDGFTPDALRRLLDHRWPGNVRELQNVVEYAFAVGRGPLVGVDDLPPELREARPAPPAAPKDEAAAIRDALARADGNVGEAARLLGMSRTTFWRQRRRLGV